MREEPDPETGISRGNNRRFSEPFWFAIILASSVTVLIITIFCLSHGTTTVFMHLYYFPIILLAYHYRYRGILPALALCAIYPGLVYLFVPGNTEEIIAAWIRFFLFIGIASVIAFLSEQLVSRQNKQIASSQKYYNLFTNMMEGFAYCRMIYDENGNPADWEFLNVNPAFEQLTGLKTITGRRALDAIPDVGEYIPTLFDTYSRVASTGKSETFEIDFKPLNLWLRVSVFSPEKDHFVVVFGDITSQKKAEIALRESEKRYRDLFEINNAVMLIIDPETETILDANDSACRFYQYSREELQGLPIIKINTASSEHIRKDIEQAAGSEGAVFQFRHRKKNGEIRDVQVFSSPITLGNRNLLHSIIQDITDRKKAEDALVQTNRKLGLLTSITRHDINNQLFSLKAYLELSKESLDNPAQMAEYLLKQEKAASAIELQIAFTQEYEDLGIKEPIWQNISTSVTNAAASLPLRDINIRNISEDIEVFADPLLEKVFYNLTDNALRYGGLTMTTITVTSHESDGNLIILFEDDGCGVSPEDKKRLFERGFGHHTGLGLFLSREVLEITGITITETGEPGKGARFEIAVPKGMWRST